MVISDDHINAKRTSIFNLFDIELAQSVVMINLCPTRFKLVEAPGY